jgi:TetR/AcrR family transcriptional regulator
VSERRFGLENSESRAALLEAAEQLMREEGYAAVTSRAVAARAGLKPQLVHYYFRTMDDLFLALLRRRAEQNTERVKRALTGSDPLRAIWELSSDAEIATLAAEFVALANHRKTIQAEIARHTDEYRRAQVEVLSKVLEESGVDPQVWPLPAIVFLLEAAARVLVMDNALGISTGHAEMIGFVEEYLSVLKDAREKRKAKGDAAPVRRQRRQ